MQHDAVVACIAVMPVSVPARSAQMQLYIAVDATAVCARQDRVAEVGSGSAAAPALIHDIVGVPALGVERLSDPGSRCPARGKLGLTLAHTHLVHAVFLPLIVPIVPVRDSTTPCLTCLSIVPRFVQVRAVVVE